MRHMCCKWAASGQVCHSCTCSERSASPQKPLFQHMPEYENLRPHVSPIVMSQGLKFKAHPHQLYLQRSSQAPDDFHTLEEVQNLPWLALC